MKLMDMKRKEFLMFCLLIPLTGLIILHFAVSRELDRAYEIIDEKDEELAFCWNSVPKIINFREEKFILIENRIQELQPRLDPILRMKIVTAIMKYSEIYRLSPSLVTHLIWRETIPHFNPLSRSRKGAIGLMQVMYEVHEELIPGLNELKPAELYHIDPNIKFGCIVLRDCIASTETLSDALKCYVGGNPDGYVSDIFKKMAELEQEKYNELSAQQKYGLKDPFSQTIHVKKKKNR